MAVVVRVLWCLSLWRGLCSHRNPMNAKFGVFLPVGSPSLSMLLRPCRRVEVSAGAGLWQSMAARQVAQSTPTFWDGAVEAAATAIGKELAASGIHRTRLDQQAQCWTRWGGTTLLPLVGPVRLDTGAAHVSDMFDFVLGVAGPARDMC